MDKKLLIVKFDVFGFKYKLFIIEILVIKLLVISREIMFWGYWLLKFFNGLMFRVYFRNCLM